MSSDIARRIKLYDSQGGRLPAFSGLKYKMMATSPFRFFRGADHIFYNDLSDTRQPVLGPVTWVCGDLNIENFTSYRGENKTFAYGINDFTNAALCPLSWELARMVSSIILALEGLRFKPTVIEDNCRHFLDTYTGILARGRILNFDPLQTKGLFNNFLIGQAMIRPRDLIKYQTTRGPKEMRELKIDKVRFFSINKDLKKELVEHINQWAKFSNTLQHRYQVADACFRVAGTGSLGAKRYALLLNDTQTRGKYILLDMLHAQPSVLPALTNGVQPVWSSEPERILTIQDRMQQVAPALASSTIFHEEEYILRRLKPASSFAKYDLLLKKKKELKQITGIMAQISASAHLRASGVKGAATVDELSAYGNNSLWQNDLLRYCHDYSQKVKSDYREYLTDYKAGVFNA